MRKERFIKLFEGLLYFIEQEEPEEEETSIEGEEDQETKDETETGKKEVETKTEKETDEEDNIEEKLSNVDKVYRLKIIYSKLIAISRVLDYYSDKRFDELRDDILEAIDLFHIVISNFDNFKDKIDDIINSYYKLLNKAIENLESLSNKE